MASGHRQDRGPGLKTPLGQRTVFVSLPDDKVITKYLESELAPAVQARFARLSVVSYRGLRQGEWLPQIERDIAFCNVVVAFLQGVNPNVMLEIGQALALGKPLVPVVTAVQSVPSMLNHLQLIKYGNLSRTSPTDGILHAIEQAVFVVLHREQSDHRTRMQKRLLLGTDLPKERLRPARAQRTRREEDELLRTARKHYEAGRFDDAVTELEGSIERGFRSEQVFHLLADTWFLNGEAVLDLTEAEDSYKELLHVADRGLSIFPGSFLLRKDRALGLMKTSRLSEAESQLNELLREFDHAIVYYNLACVNALLGNRMKTVAMLESAVVREPYYRELARVDPDFDPVWYDTLFQALVFQTNRRSSAAP